MLSRPLVNTTTNAEVGTVDAENVGAGTGYAAFRMANRRGRIGDSYETNIHVKKVIARGGGRGIFCVFESGARSSAVTDSSIKESPCAENTVIKNVELVNTTKDVC
ncbi:hypothetical protein ACFYWS_25485 [Streptomyces sp. NPDC002795]|uniref:hypothetical protein n=1 Tax=Streptomyces sp. NPDC002795 TaxID=3364665 RepID=UPI0036C8C1E8